MYQLTKGFNMKQLPGQPSLLVIALSSPWNRSRRRSSSSREMTQTRPKRPPNYYFCPNIWEKYRRSIGLFFQVAAAEDFKTFLKWILNHYSKIQASDNFNNYWRILNMHMFNHYNHELNIKKMWHVIYYKTHNHLKKNFVNIFIIHNLKIFSSKNVNFVDFQNKWKINKSQFFFKILEYLKKEIWKKIMITTINHYQTFKKNKLNWSFKSFVDLNFSWCILIFISCLHQNVWQYKKKFEQKNNFSTWHQIFCAKKCIKYFK